MRTIDGAFYGHTHISHGSAGRVCYPVLERGFEHGRAQRFRLRPNARAVRRVQLLRLQGQRGSECRIRRSVEHLHNLDAAIRAEARISWDASTALRAEFRRSPCARPALLCCRTSREIGLPPCQNIRPSLFEMLAVLDFELLFGG